MIILIWNDSYQVGVDLIETFDVDHIGDWFQKKYG